MEENLSTRQSEIIQTAIRLIGEGGIQALTIKNLSSEIGIAESTIYRHFESKTEVLITLLDYLKSVFKAYYERSINLNISPTKKLQEMISGHLGIFAENHSYAIVILSDGLYKNEKTLHERIFGIMQISRAAFIKVIDEGKVCGEIRKDVPSDEIAFIIMGSVRLTINQWSLLDFSFDLLERGDALFYSLKKLIRS
jgi:AcrR family transcriptional regulator